MIFSSPTSSFGYYRGQPMAGGVGSGMGPSMAGNGFFAAGQGSITDQWSPTILYLIALIIVEMVVFGFLARFV